jgi:hypothetical protein
MLFSTINETACSGLHVPVAPRSSAARIKRIAAVLGLTKDGLPRVDEETLARYYRHLSSNLTWPFTAHYPRPTTPKENAEFRCTVLELLDPIKDIYDDLDGIFCKTRKGKYELNLPLSELVLPEDSPNCQLIEDYWYWFANWR